MNEIADISEFLSISNAATPKKDLYGEMLEKVVTPKKDLYGEILEKIENPNLLPSQIDRELYLLERDGSLPDLINPKSKFYINPSRNKKKAAVVQQLNQLREMGRLIRAVVESRVLDEVGKQEKSIPKLLEKVENLEQHMAESISALIQRSAEAYKKARESVAEAERLASIAEKIVADAKGKIETVAEKSLEATVPETPTTEAPTTETSMQEE